jgi:hypothetical protein
MCFLHRSHSSAAYPHPHPRLRWRSWRRFQLRAPSDGLSRRFRKRERHRGTGTRDKRKRAVGAWRERHRRADPEGKYTRLDFEAIVISPQLAVGGSERNAADSCLRDPVFLPDAMTVCVLVDHEQRPPAQDCPVMRAFCRLNVAPLLFRRRR